ncbi:hypothetical protein MHN79_13175 [Vibrio sp. Of14-4]|uniref:hypothetical protein n=1 Tax=Vibrio sp. Of14-4 TaxID=2724878 RepID=UPI001EF3CCA1|nr:hypothetical protein [Vibrio sp. Of14-4]MCG7490442.1 hypothetical protein [Vibrio sp. Of14-4]
MKIVFQTSRFRYFLSVVLSLIALVAISTPSQVLAQNIQDLERSNDIELRTWVGKQNDVRNDRKTQSFSINEQVILYIEVATPRWFTGGTRIGRIEIPNVIAKQRNQLATNYTEKKQGKTWSRQRWEVTLYPQSSGKFVVPPVPVSVQVSAPNGKSVSGTLYTRPIRFEAKLPSGLVSVEGQWFTATDVDVKQTWSTSNDELKVGDAITRTVVINAKDSLSVLLPDILSDRATPQYQAYPKPNKLADTATRGDYQSSRVEEMVYVIQQGGELSLPEYQFQWWNSKTKQLETHTVAGKIFIAKQTFQSFVRAYSLWFYIAAVIILATGLMLLTARRYYCNHPRPAWWVLNRLLKDERWSDARTFLYRHLRMNTNELEMSKLLTSDTWLKQSGRFQDGDKNRHLFVSLWKVIKGMRTSRFRLASFKALPRLAKAQRNRS